jgi:hypothetical protein
MVEVRDVQREKAHEKIGWRGEGTLLKKVSGFPVPCRDVTY